VFNQFGDLEGYGLRSGNAHSAYGWRAVLGPEIARYRGGRYVMFQMAVVTVPRQMFHNIRRLIA